MRFQKQRETLIQKLRSKGIEDETVLSAIKKAPRHVFIPSAFEFQAYEDMALPIGYGQTISHPYTVAKMTEILHVAKGDKILEIGTGSGYQCAVLCELGAHVFTVEIEKRLADQAKKKLSDLRYNFASRIGDGRQGWPEYAPYQGIIVTAATKKVPEILLEQLDNNGRLLIPLGSHERQILTLHIKKKDIMEKYQLEEFKFVTLTKNRS
jgi:protein-L-isoaspartate(D-aspartate) O-methyltransferase